MTFAKWQEFLAPQRAADAGPAPTPAEVATAVDALGVLREIAPEPEVCARQRRRTQGPRPAQSRCSRAKAMQLYGLALPDGLVAPDLQQLLHTKPGDNCPICRMRPQMQDAGKRVVGSHPGGAPRRPKVARSQS